MANFNFNKVIIGGRLTADPELRQTSNGIAVTSFSVAVNRRPSKSSDGQTQQQTDFLNCTAWRSNAEFITRYFRKGSSICVVGQLQTRKWTDQSNVTRYATDIVVDEAHFVDSKGEGSFSGAPASSVPASAENMGAPGFSNGVSSPSDFEVVSNDDDLPF